MLVFSLVFLNSLKGSYPLLTFPSVQSKLRWLRLLILLMPIVSMLLSYDRISLLLCLCGNFDFQFIQKFRFIDQLWFRTESGDSCWIWVLQRWRLLAQEIRSGAFVDFTGDYTLKFPQEINLSCFVGGLSLKRCLLSFVLRLRWRKGSKESSSNLLSSFYEQSLPYQKSESGCEPLDEKTSRYSLKISWRSRLPSWVIWISLPQKEADKILELFTFLPASFVFSSYSIVSQLFLGRQETIFKNLSNPWHIMAPDSKNSRRLNKVSSFLIPYAWAEASTVKQQTTRCVFNITALPVLFLSGSTRKLQAQQRKDRVHFDMIFENNRQGRKYRLSMAQSGPQVNTFFLEEWPWKSKNMRGLYLAARDLIRATSGRSWGWLKQRLMSLPSRLVRKLPAMTPSILTIGIILNVSLSRSYFPFGEQRKSKKPWSSQLPCVSPGCSLPITRQTSFSSFPSETVNTGIGNPPTDRLLLSTLKISPHFFSSSFNLCQRSEQEYGTQQAKQTYSSYRLNYTQKDSVKMGLSSYWFLSVQLHFLDAQNSIFQRSWTHYLLEERYVQTPIPVSYDSSPREKLQMLSLALCLSRKLVTLKKNQQV